MTPAEQQQLSKRDELRREGHTITCDLRSTAFFPNRLTGRLIQSLQDKWVPVTRATRARAAGKLIKCPHCGTEAKVYHFSWSAVTCQGCNRMVDKYDWSCKK